MEKYSSMKTKINVLLLIIFLSLFSGCEWLDPETTDEPLKEWSYAQITNYLERNDSLTIMAELLEKTGYSGLFNTYGQSTVLAPTDAAFKAYFASIGKSGLDDLSKDEIEGLAKYHIVVRQVNVQALPTGMFNFSDTTINGIRHFLDVSGGFDNIEIDKTAKIIKTQELDNGIVYQLDQVLETHPDNIYDYLVSKGNYTIMVDAIDAAGYKDSLQVLDRIYNSIILGELKYTYLYTMFAETDEVFNANGITSLDQLKSAILAKNSSQGKTADEALLDFIEYHILYDFGRRFSFQMFKNENIRTITEDGGLSIHITESDIVRPDPLINASSGGARLSYKKSDVVLKNGVLHELDNVLFIPDAPTKANISVECEKIVFYFGHSLDFVKVGGDFEKGVLDYERNEEYSTEDTDDDGLALVFRPTDVGGWVEFLIPNVAPGKYDINIDYKESGTQASTNVNVYFRNTKDEFDWKNQLLLKEFNMSGNETDNDGEELDLYTDYGQNRFLKTVEIDSYGTYAIRFAHADIKSGFYDVIRLTVSENPVE